MTLQNKFTFENKYKTYHSYNF